MRSPLALALTVTGISIVLASACGTITPEADGSGQAGSSGQGGSSSGSGGAAAGTTGQGGAVAGTTGQAGTGPGGTTGAGGRGGQAGGTAGTTAAGGRGGQAGGAAGTTGVGGRGGQAGGTAGAGGRGGATGTAGRGGQAGQNNDGGVSCDDLEAEYSKAVAEARMCNPDATTGQCQMLVNTGLACPLCQVRVNDATRPNQIRMQWTKQGCTPPIVCPQVICVSPGTGVCSKTDASGSGGMCTMLATPGPI